MQILIIGSKGFIGSHLYEYFLLFQENTVTGCDFKSDPDPNYIQADKLNTDYDSIFNTSKFDICIYAGGNGSVPYSLEYPDVDYQLNTNAIDQILSAIRKHQPQCKFIQFSSAAVYGNPELLPISEENKIAPMSPYGWHKYMAEIVCKKFTALYNIPTISLRIFSVYGEGLRKQLFWDIYQKIRMSNIITLFGTGNESRDFIHISDLVKAIDVVIRNAKFQGEVYNVSSGNETSIKEAAEIFCTLYNKELKVNFGGESKSGDPINWRADITKLKKFGFVPKVELSEGLEKYVSWLKEKE